MFIILKKKKLLLTLLRLLLLVLLLSSLLLIFSALLLGSSKSKWKRRQREFFTMIPLQQFSVLKVIQMQGYYTCANDSISRIPNMTRTVEWSFGVCTVSIFMAIVGVVDVMRSKTSFIALSYVFEKKWNKKWDQIHNWDFLSNSVCLPTHVTPSPE